MRGNVGKTRLRCGSSVGWFALIEIGLAVLASAGRGLPEVGLRQGSLARKDHERSVAKKFRLAYCLRNAFYACIDYPIYVTEAT